MRTSMLAVILLGACAAEPTDSCRAAAEHVESCTGEAPAAAPTCDPEAAEEVLARDCSQLAAGDGKGDAGYGGRLLCNLGFESYCTWQFEGTFVRADTGAPLRNRGIQQDEIGALSTSWTDDRGIARFDDWHRDSNRVSVSSVDNEGQYRGAVTCEGTIQKLATFATVKRSYVVTFRRDLPYMVESCVLAP
jgi:hypothetical protein